jgi:hypothetical protein
VGYPLRKWCYSLRKTRKDCISLSIHEHKRQIKQIQRNPPTEEGRLSVQGHEDIIDSLEWESFKLDAWHKPILTCAACMCSFHGVLISVYFICLVSFNIIYIAPFSVMLSVVINSIYSKKYL